MQNIEDPCTQLVRELEAVSTVGSSLFCSCDNKNL